MPGALRKLWLVGALLCGLALAPAHAEQIELEVACFKGGYGSDFFEQCAREYEKMHPNVKIKLWGDPRVWEKLLPRFVAGNPPDLCWPGWGMNTWELIFGGQLRPLNAYLEQQAYGSQKKWGETFVQSLLRKGFHKGSYYLLPYNVESFGWWYNAKMFREHGWQPPKTYEELLELCEKIKDKHIAPVTFTGRYPDYMYRGFYYPWVISAGGLEAFIRAQNLEPGAWKDPAFLKAAECVVDMKKRGNFQAGCVGMNHTESQMEFLVGRVAMIPCGTWLRAEMKAMLPKDFELGFFLCPPFADGKGDPSLVSAGPDGRGWCIPTKGKHPDTAADFMRYMSSPEAAKRFIETKGTLMAVQTEGEVNAPEHLKEPLRLVRAASATWAIDTGEWYPAMNTEQCDAMRDLYNGILTPRKFVDQLEEIARKIREDKNVHKFTVQ